MLNQNTSNQITVTEIKKLLDEGTISVAYARNILGFKDEIMTEKFKGLREKIVADFIDSDLITFGQRLARIYNSCTGEHNVNRKHTSCFEQMVFPDEDNVFFFIRHSSGSYALKELVFCVQDVYFNVPIGDFPTGMGLLTPFLSRPDTSQAIDNVKGEIADFIDDYLEEYGTEDEFIPNS